jgi:POT family proton-dependent oligopeptide transporter
MTRIAAAPDGLGRLCVSVGFERAAYYGLQSILALYLASTLTDDRSASTIWMLADLALLTQSDGIALASVITGLFVSVAAIAPVIGGVVADRITGQRRAVIIGGMMMASGHGLLIVEAALLPALLAIAVGSGFFKGPAAAQLSGLYQQDDAARVEGFRLFYIAINLAGLIAPLVIGTMAERVHWHAGFAVSCLAMIIGLTIFWRGLTPVAPAMSALVSVPGIALAGGRADSLTLSILGASTAMIAVPNFQITNAYLLWADRAFNLSVVGWRFPASWMIAADGLLGLLALIVSALVWRCHERRRGPVRAAAKAALGAALVIFGTASLVLGASLHGQSGVPVYWGLGFQLLNSFGLANVLPAVMALFGQAGSSRFVATAMAGFYLSLFVGGMVSTALAAQFTVLPPVSFWLLHAACATLGMVGLAVVLWRTKASGPFERAPLQA